MKATELRIGNIVTHKDINIFRVDEIRQTNEGRYPVKVDKRTIVYKKLLTKS